MRSLVLAFTTSMLAVSSASAFDGWRLQSSEAIPSSGSSWDYLHIEPDRQRLFIGHRQEGLQVYDLRTKAVVKVVEGTDKRSSNGVTFVPGFDLAVSNNQDGTITPFKLSTLEASEAIKLSEEIDNSHYDPATKRLIVNVAPGKDGTELAVLDVPSFKTVGTIKVPTLKPEHADFDGSGIMFLAARDTDMVYRIDLRAMAVTASWSTMPGCAGTNSMIYDSANKRILLGCRGTEKTKPSFAVMNAETGKVVYSAEIGGGVDGLAYDPRTRRVFVSCGVHAVLNVFEQQSADAYRPVEALGTEAGARTLAYDPSSERLYSVTAQGTADFSKKITTSVSAFYANYFFKDSFKLLTYSK